MQKNTLKQRESFVAVYFYYLFTIHLNLQVQIIISTEQILS